MKSCKLFIFLMLLLCMMIEPVSAQYVRQWVARYTGPTKKTNEVASMMAADDSGFVYVTGWTKRKTTNVDYVTLKYSPDGELVWSAFYGATGKGDDKALAMAVDTSHNVYVTGTSATTSNGLNIVTVKYDSNGIILWTKSYNGSGNGEDVPVAIAVNDSQHVYVSGYSVGAGTSYDYITIKYDSLGNEVWAKRYNGPANGDDRAYAMALRGTTDVYVTGASTDTMYDYFTIKYNAATGDSVWGVRYNGSGDGDDIARGIVLRSSTDLVITGSSKDSVNGFDYVTIRYNSSGVEQWNARYNGNANSDDHAYAIDIHSNSRIYVTGRSLQVGSFNDATTVKYNYSNGSEDWVMNFNGAANDDDKGVAMVGGGSPYVAAASSGFGVGFDYALISYNGSNGDENWNTTYNGTGNLDDIPVDILSSDGAIYVTGKSSPDAKTTDIVTIKYVDKNKLKYRTVLQDSLAGKANNLTKSTANYGNFRDEAFAKAFPKIKKGFPGAPGGMVLGNARPDSALAYGWVRMTSGKAITKFIPQTGTPRGFDLYGGVSFVGEKKDAKLDKYNNKLVGNLIALRLNIGASDAEVTPPTFGNLTYEGFDTVGGLVLTGMSLRQIASLTDNFLTYWQKYPTLEWSRLDSVLAKINSAFTGELKVVSASPLVFTGAVLIDSVVFLSPGIAPMTEPLKFIPGSLDETPTTFALSQNYPNPFNPNTNFGFRIATFGLVNLKVYDMIGREVATVVDNQTMEEGEYEFSFDGSSLASGVYFYRLFVTPVDGSENFTDVKRMLMMK
ncbi:MAG: T9SS type A sorting domain-containing protein [Ignavibacteriae bacterium]|nr:T9SS type A sorting domain-containing protein [Ignavibacteriota bacterium]